MKQPLLSLLAACVLAVSVVGTVSAEDGVTYKFSCADITGGGGQLLFDEATGRYDFGFNLTTPSRCGGMVYTMYVFDTEADCLAARAGGAATPLATLVERGADPTGEGTGQVVFEADSLSADTSTWVYATTSRANTTFDVAPDVGEGCVEVGLDPPSSGKFR